MCFPPDERHKTLSTFSAEWSNLVRSGTANNTQIYLHCRLHSQQDARVAVSLQKRAAPLVPSCGWQQSER